MLSKPNIHMVGLCSLSGTLGRGDIDPVMGEHPLEFSFNSIFPSFGNPYILKADNWGPLLEYLVYFLLTLLVSVGTHII